MRFYVGVQVRPFKVAGREAGSTAIGALADPLMMMLTTRTGITVARGGDFKQTKGINRCSDVDKITGIERIALILP
jgi:hypothetical protein